jgi:two-component sensor histidine kinase
VPDTSGFGWTVIRTSVEDQLNGQLATDWGVQGLRVTMDVPLAEIGDLLS